MELIMANHADHFGHFRRAELALRLALAFVAGMLVSMAMMAALFGAWVHAIAPAVIAAGFVAILIWLDYWDVMRRPRSEGI
jgi:hypothetical protein